MSSERMTDAVAMPAPVAADGDVIVAAISAAAGDAIDVFGKTRGAPEFWHAYAEGTDLYFTAGVSTIVAPVPTAVAGPTRAVWVPQGTALPLEFDAYRRYLRPIGSGSGYVRLIKISRRKET